MLKAHESLLSCTELLDALRTLRNDSGCSRREFGSVQHSLIELGREVPLLEVKLNLRLHTPHQLLTDSEGRICFCSFTLLLSIDVHLI